jgi:flavin-binding protein dodecin
MSGATYKLIDLVGTSESGVDDAIKSAIAQAAQTLKGLDWFEVTQIRGRIEDNHAAWFQVEMKVGFRVMTGDELASAGEQVATGRRNGP